MKEVFAPKTESNLPTRTLSMSIRCSHSKFLRALLAANSKLMTQLRLKPSKTQKVMINSQITMMKSSQTASLVLVIKSTTTSFNQKLRKLTK